MMMIIIKIIIIINNNDNNDNNNNNDNSSLHECLQTLFTTNNKRQRTILPISFSYRKNKLERRPNTDPWSYHLN
jgi:hypothetical protein